MRREPRITRRRFLRGVGAAGVGAWAAPQILPSGAWGAAGDRLNVALLGCGNRTGQILPSILQGGGNIVAICDVNTARVARLKALAAERPEPAAATVGTARVYEDYRKLLAAEKSVDAVVIAVGQRWHTPLSKAAIQASKHVFCEKPLAHSVADSRELRELGRQTKLVTQVGSQGGTSDTFRRSMEIIQAGLLGQVREVHCWVTRDYPPSAPLDRNADPIPEGLNWDFWCGPSALLPFKDYYLKFNNRETCMSWGRWLEFGDGHLADMGAHGFNLPWRALKLGNVVKASVKIPEPLKDAYPSATEFRFEFAAREGMDPVTVWWHDGKQAGPPQEAGNELLGTYKKVPGDGVLFLGEKGMLLSNAWGANCVVKMKGEKRFRGVQDHDACKPIPVTLPRKQGQNHMAEWLDACRGDGKTFQPFATGASIAEIAMVGMIALRLGREIEWDGDSMKVRNAPEADPLVHREHRKKWL